MTDQQHPIIPPPELVGEWLCSEDYLSDASTLTSMTITSSRLQNVATQAARWGADQELEACCSIAVNDPVCGTKFQRESLVRHIKEQRRPKAPSLKKQALSALYAIATSADDTREFYQDIETIKVALESLAD